MSTIKLDAKKLLGFRLTAGVTSTKLGQKAGVKFGAKAGSKRGVKR